MPNSGDRILPCEAESKPRAIRSEARLEGNSNSVEQATASLDARDEGQLAIAIDSDPFLIADGLTLDVEAFHEELQRRNRPILLWTAIVVTSLYVAWTVFDFFLVPELWFYFLLLRLTAAGINTVVAVVVLRPGMERHTWLGLWILAFVYCAFIAPMLPRVGENLSPFVMGLAVTMIGIGVVPVWHPRWVLTVLLASLGVNVLAFSIAWTGGFSVREVVGNIFLVMTAAGLSLLATVFKYDIAKRDFLSRVRLATVAKRESEARLDLARTSGELQEALEKLKELDRLKSEFFANISHELRTPLTLILAPVEELALVAESDFQKQQLRVIRNNAERLLGLINDLLDLSRLDAGGLRLNLDDMDIRSVAAAVYENSSPAAHAKDIDFRFDTEPSERKIFGDAHRLEIVLTNLVSNALKFTPRHGTIEIRVRDLEDAVQIEIEDNGPGIPVEDLPKIFERFFQVNPADRRREGGVGIGLALAKELVELHGGSVDVASEPGQFTRFVVMLPFGRDHIRPEVVERRRQFGPASERRRVEDQQIPVVQDGGLTDAAEGAAHEVEELVLIGGRRPRIVLAEDNPEVRNFVRGLLETQFDVRTAGDGEEAWEEIQHDPPDLVVSDVMMPAMSGTELCGAIKNDARLRSIPVILLTAKVGSEATLEAYAHGADDFVAKPFHPRVLIARIRAQIRLRAFALQLAQQEKLAVVGTLAAGILHEVRNPVNAILNASRVLSEGSTQPKVERQLLEVITDGANRIDEITAALDTHARPAESGETGVSDVGESLEATLRLLRYRMAGVTVHRDYRTGRLANAPAGQVSQVFLNLIDNALRVGAKNLWLAVAEEHDRLVISVGDDGPGVPPEDADRIFDPFFSNREDGSGTGLGLSLSRGMVEEAGGSLRVEERPGGGAVFIVEMPAVS
ncbi:MAG: ATP-binding protein [Thermoanaerobaculales bacterium]